MQSEPQIRRGATLTYQDIKTLGMAIRHAARYTQDAARPGSELSLIAETLHRFADLLGDAVEADIRRKSGVSWEDVFNFIDQRGRRGGE
jgi:hypothetical protein